MEGPGLELGGVPTRTERIANQDNVGADSQVTPGRPGQRVALVTAATLVEPAGVLMQD